ncbi:MAG TPA: ATP-dependent DNA helicase RecQ [Vicinamibacterales bacterium]|nr:ATP-dependent DNA helicase RecQ [Vicinamibacterales bacterium]
MRKLRRDLERTLQTVFGLDALRPGQDEVIQSVLGGTHTIAVMPTGAGKSLCYQLPALLLPGMTIVVSPLIALMKDQYDKMQELGLAASQVNSAVPGAEQAEHLERIASAEAEFVFTTPEQLTNPEFLSELADKEIDLFVIDEAHCISQWGHDFRPAYLALGDAARKLNAPTILALTATATPKVIDDIRGKLGVEPVNVINTDLYRPNLSFAVRPVDSEADKEKETAELLASSKGTSIIYTATVAHAESLAGVLRGTGKRVARYHGKVAARERHEIQNAFMSGQLDAIVATNAFGMGIDKADIRLVLHYDMPGSLDAYYQEAGRAGRDGEPAQCVLLFRRQDRNVHNFLMAGRYPTLDGFLEVARVLEAATDTMTAADVKDAAAGVALSKVRVILSSLKAAGIVAERHRGRFALKRHASAAEIADAANGYLARAAADREKLERMVIYGQTAMCRWSMILKYFGGTEMQEPCGHCDTCAGTAVPAVGAAAGASA